VTDRVDVRAAHAELVSLLRRGEFADPPPGQWSAEMIAAHVVLNNDHFTLAARAVAAGEPVVFDNETALQDELLRGYAAEHGGVVGMAAQVLRSAEELARARAALRGQTAEQPVHVRLRHDGQLLMDEPRPIAALIDRNVTSHLSNHLRQLQQLVTGPDAPAGGAPHPPS
jgi:hypothetical protein